MSHSREEITEIRDRIEKRRVKRERIRSPKVAHKLTVLGVPISGITEIALPVLIDVSLSGVGFFCSLVFWGVSSMENDATDTEKFNPQRDEAELDEALECLRDNRT